MQGATQASINGNHFKTWLVHFIPPTKSLDVRVRTRLECGWSRGKSSRTHHGMNCNNRQVKSDHLGSTARQLQRRKTVINQRHITFKTPTTSRIHEDHLKSTAITWPMNSQVPYHNPQMNQSRGTAITWNRWQDIINGISPSTDWTPKITSQVRRNETRRQCISTENAE